jgi:hypothetical protein
LFAVVRDGARVIDRVCGKQDESLRPWAQFVTPVSDVLDLEVTDDDSGAWGHLLVDDVLIWEPTP